MVASSVCSKDDSIAIQLLNWIADIGIHGLGFLPSAEAAAAESMAGNANIEDAIDSVIAWRTTYAAGTGFISGLGSIAALPISIPASIAISYALGANTIATIAKLRGYDVHSQQVRTMILLSVIGEAGIEILRNAGMQIGNKVLMNLVGQVPGKVLIEINKQIGFRLITKSGETGVINLVKLVPIAGGVVGAGFDGWFVNTCGNTARQCFLARS